MEKKTGKEEFLVLRFLESGEDKTKTEIVFDLRSMNDLDVKKIIAIGVGTAEGVRLMLDLFQQTESVMGSILGLHHFLSSIGTPVSAHSVPVPATITGTVVSTATSAITVKTALASIITVVLITNGAYVMEPELFGMNQFIDDVPDVSTRSDISLVETSDTNTISRDGVFLDGGSKSSSSDISDDVSNAISPIDSQDTLDHIDSQDTLDHIDSQDTLDQVSSTISNSDIISLTTIIQPRSFDNPVSVVFADGISSTGVVFDSKGNMYATDLDEHSIKVFDPDGKIMKTLGKNSITPMSFKLSGLEIMSKLSSLFVQYAHAAEKILYCDINTGMGCIDPDGIGPLRAGDGQFNEPYGLAIDSGDNLYVTDSANDRIQVFDSDGTFIKTFGEQGFQDGQFNEPYGLAIDSGDTLYVVDRKKL